MAGQLHFISGLPRSGSTLLGAILKQNPEVAAGMSSPLAGIVINLMNIMSAKNEFSSFITDVHRLRVIKSVIESYHGMQDRHDTVFDTSRAWTGKLPAIAMMFPDSKVICCVRSLGWISDSFEQIVARNPLQPSGVFGYEAGGNVVARLEHLHSPKGLLGISMANLREAFYGEYSARVLVVRYDTLVSRPVEAIDEIYKFCGMTRFEHDFGNLAYDAESFDTRIGTPGLHRVFDRVVSSTRMSLLGPDLFNRFSGGEFWADPSKNVRGVRVV